MSVEPAEKNGLSSEPLRVASSVPDAPIIEKKRVADSFGRAAASYDNVAHFQRSVGGRLLSLLPARSNAIVIDLGCGTGFFTPMLASRMCDAHVVGVDLSEGMVSYANSQRGDHQLGWAVGDAESLPLKNESVDVIYSSLAVQWCSSYQSLFKELHRVLKPGGIVAFSTLLDGTLKELEQSWASADSFRHVNSFAHASSVLDAATVSGFECIDVDQYTDVLRYDSVQALTRELKMLGAHNLNEGRPINITGRERIRRFKHSYESLRTADGWLPATYEVLLSVLTKPAD